MTTAKSQQNAAPELPNVARLFPWVNTTGKPARNREARAAKLRHEQAVAALQGIVDSVPVLRGRVADAETSAREWKQAANLAQGEVVGHKLRADYFQGEHGKLQERVRYLIETVLPQMLGILWRLARVSRGRLKGVNIHVDTRGHISGYFTIGDHSLSHEVSSDQLGVDTAGVTFDLDNGDLTSQQLALLRRTLRGAPEPVEVILLRLVRSRYAALSVPGCGRCKPCRQLIKVLAGSQEIDEVVQALDENQPCRNLRSAVDRGQRLEV